MVTPEVSGITISEIVQSLIPSFCQFLIIRLMANDTLLREAAEYRDDGSEFSIAALSYEQADAMMEVRNATK